MQAGYQAIASPFEWTETELERLPAASRKRATHKESRYDYSPLIEPAAFSGLRLGECLGLDWPACELVKSAGVITACSSGRGCPSAWLDDAPASVSSGGARSSDLVTAVASAAVMRAKEATVKKALSTIFAAAALVVVVVPAADATLARTLPTTYSHAKAAKVAKTATKARHAAQATSIFVPFVVICPEQAPGDSWGYCITIPSQSDVGTPSTDASATSVTYNDGAGT